MSESASNFRWWGSTVAGAGPGSRSRRENRRRLRPGLMQLEERRLLYAYVVNTVADGPQQGTLRRAILSENTIPGNNTVEFDPTVFSTPQTITLTQGPLDLNNMIEPEVINGPSAGVTISGGGNTQVFNIESGVTATMTGLTITGGKASYGGGLYNNGTLNLNYCTVAGNEANDDGGGLYNLNGNANLNECTFSQNSAGYYGGGVYNLDEVGLGTNSYAATVVNCTFSGNSAKDGGGLYDSAAGNMFLTFCTVSGNTDTSTGGGVYNANEGNHGGYGLVLDSTIVAGNTNTSQCPTTLTGTGGARGNNNLIGTGGYDGLDPVGSGNQIGVADPLLGQLGDDWWADRDHCAGTQQPGHRSGRKWYRNDRSAWLLAA